ncbi:MAG: NUDIX domain-containing protein [Candidatus Marsarchaeota archaeon]|nr:NUDIX domain-containing protein [Candidatus Marsarchaeota archaeon]MCL5105989.1 NUDIX domain-containing protein [Candidatus Marsarchaeota archaeon]
MAIPFIINRGIWSFITGKLNKNESYLLAAYREIEEETKITKDNLVLAVKPFRARLLDVHNGKQWQNTIFIFYSNTREVTLNIENSRFRWAPLDDIKNYNDYTNIFCNEKKILGILSKALIRLRPEI